MTLVMKGLCHHTMGETKSSFSKRWRCMCDDVCKDQTGSSGKAVGDVLPKIHLSDNSVDTGISVQLFLTQVLGSDVGISVAGFFVIQKSTFLTIVETLMTYSAVVLQLPSSQA
ncbi:uncharacterized protein [Haliotis asinina]|uniref:uncharacterized protein n=1 Tax=Haliotis asinina TaxID=109174 RepID=UPI003531DDF7